MKASVEICKMRILRRTSEPKSFSVLREESCALEDHAELKAEHDRKSVQVVELITQVSDLEDSSTPYAQKKPSRNHKKDLQVESDNA